MSDSRTLLPVVAGVMALGLVAGWARGAQPVATVEEGTSLEFTLDPASVARPFSRPADPEPDPEPKELTSLGSRFTVELGGAYVSQYFFRGIIQEDQGFIFQPYVDVTFNVLRDGDFSLDLNGGLWSSFHGNTDTAEEAAGLPNYYELDLYAGLTATVGRFSVGTTFVAYTSPSGAFDTVEEIDVILGYNDSEAPLLGPVTLSPTVTFAFEVGADAADGSGPGGYVELGLSPGYTFGEGWLASGVTLSAPLTLGLSLYDYYEFDTGDDEAFGFFDAGLEASYLLPLDPSFGNVTLSAGVHFLILGDALEAVNDGDGFEVVFSGGFSIAF